MKSWKREKDANIISGINITPLTDVMLVLLVIFMVTTPLLMEAAFKINLPRASTAERLSGKDITVSIAEGDVIYVNEEKVEMGGLKKTLGRFLKGDKGKMVVLKADRTILHGTVVKVLDIVKSSGVTRLSIAIEPENTN